MGRAERSRTHYSGQLLTVLTLSCDTYLNKISLFRDFIGGGGKSWEGDVLGRILSSEFIQLLRRLDFMARMATKVSVCSQFQLYIYTIFLVALVVNNPPGNAGVRNAGSIPGSGRSPGGGHNNLLQYPCLENPMDRGVWWATLHRVTKNRTQLECLSMHAPYFYFSDILQRTEQKEMNFVRSSLDIWGNICFSHLGLYSLLFVSHIHAQDHSTGRKDMP